MNISVVRTLGTQWWLLVMVMVAATVMEVMGLNGDNVCMVKQKYNITKRVKYRAPMSVRTYVWCFSMPPRCSKWTTEMRDLTRLESEERTAEVAVCCPGYKMRDVSCVPICPHGKTGDGCSHDCPSNKWGPNCVHDCKKCDHGTCSAVTGECQCQTGWQGERCEIIIQTTTTPVVMDELLTTNKITPKLLIKPTAKMTVSASATSASIAPSTPSNLFKNDFTERLTPTTIAVRKDEIIRSTLEPTTTTRMTTMKTITPSTVVEERKAPNVVSVTTYSNTTKSNTYKATSLYLNVSLSTTTRLPEHNKKRNQNQFIYNQTEIPTTSSIYTQETSEEITQKTVFITTTPLTPSIIRITSEPHMTSVAVSTNRRKTSEIDTTKRPDTTIPQSTSSRLKFKEIWIKPAQKGESSIETKIKEDAQQRLKPNKKEQLSTNTTPKTIVVSIIPTSSYTSFKKIAVSTTSYVPVRMYSKVLVHSGPNVTRVISNISSTSMPYVPVKKFNVFKTNILNGTAKPLLFSTSTVSTLASQNTTAKLRSTNPSITFNHNQVPTNKTIFNSMPTKDVLKTTKLMSVTTNSMSRPLTDKNNTSPELTTALITTQNVSSTTRFLNATESTVTVSKSFKSTTPIIASNLPTTIRNMIEKTIKNVVHQSERTMVVNASKVARVTNETKKNETNTKFVTTPLPDTNEEKFHILTEPEPITDVMSDKERTVGRTTVDLTSVISIAGGVMMVIITLAILLVMMERRKKPRYDEIRKMDEMRMQVYLDENNVPPPPYVRSIFHTPLPDLPTVEKCHYQPISTLDRNIKQFMRPVVVQTITPVMLENFRGILECHYDHLPLRNSLPIRQDERLTPSMEECHELLCTHRQSITDSTIEALRCEAKQDVLDITTSEPLYAEIPCWRPPSEHAVEVVNLSGEAVTEL